MKSMYIKLILPGLLAMTSLVAAQGTQTKAFNPPTLINSNLIFNDQIKIVNLGPSVNHSGVDYAPTVTIDGKTLFFVSNRPGSKSLYQPDPAKPSRATISRNASHDFWAVKKNETNGMDFYGLYNIDTVSTGLSGINTELNEGAASISADGSKIFFTGCNRSDGLGDCDLYVSYFNGEKWGRPINLGVNVNSVYWDTQPSISPYDRRLYFLSNRPLTDSSAPVGMDGGNLDIWYCDWNEENGEFDPAQNLSAVNTPKNEFSPFIASDGVTLFFSSDGLKPNFGGYDFYVTKFDLHSKSWSKPEHLSKPVNTSNNDIFLTIPATSNAIYFSSERTDIKGYMGDLDIYMAYIPDNPADNKPDDDSISIFRAYPNPFNKIVNIEFNIEKESKVEIVLSNVYGEELKVLENRTLAPDKYNLTWDGTNIDNREVPSGVYYCTMTIETGGAVRSMTKEMILVR